MRSVLYFYSSHEWYISPSEVVVRLPVEMSSRPLEDLRKLVVQNDCLLVGAAAAEAGPARTACPMTLTTC